MYKLDHIPHEICEKLPSYIPAYDTLVLSIIVTGENGATLHTVTKTEVIDFPAPSMGSGGPPALAFGGSDTSNGNEDRELGSSPHQPSVQCRYMVDGFEGIWRVPANFDTEFQDLVLPKYIEKTAGLA